MLRRLMMAGAGSSVLPDPYWANVISLLHFDAANGTTTFTDAVVGTTWSRVSGAEISTTKARFGGSSASVPAAVNSGYGCITSNGNSAFAFGTGDFTIEGFLNVSTSKSGFRFVFDTRPTGVNGAYPSLYVDGTSLVYYQGGAARITGTNAISLVDAWVHWAVSRVSGVTRLFVNGTQVGSSYTDATNYANQRFRLGNTSSADNFDSILGGYLDECRITKGVGRYSLSFTPPTIPYPSF